MKILAIGDFHGKFPKKFEKLIKKEKIDFILSNGDYPSFSLEKVFFKKVYMHPEKNLWEVVGKKKYKEKTLKDLKNGESVLKKLNNLRIPVFTVLGNHDYPNPNDIRDLDRKLEKRFSWKWEDNRLKFYPEIIKKYKNIQRVDYSYGKFKDYIIIGARGHSVPGRVKSKAYRKYKKKLDTLFKKFNKENKEKKVIFLSHNVPYRTKLDKITSKKAHEHAQKKHAGSKMFRRIIKKYQPILHVGGHIGEGMGKDKIGKTILMNPGEAHEGKAAVIEIDKGKVKKIKFIR